MQVIAIAGASDGIGAEMARQLAQRHGASLGLVLAARGEEKLAQVGAQCAAHGSQVLTQRCDVALAAQCRALIEAALERFGRLDALVNNAGMSAHAWFEDVEDLGWYEELMRINLWGSVWCTHAALPALKASRGRIVAVSSLAGLFGVPARTAYSASKFAMTGFFEALRTELAPQGVSVTIAYPAWWPPRSAAAATTRPADRPAAAGSTRPAPCRSMNAPASSSTAWSGGAATW